MEKIHFSEDDEVVVQEKLEQIRNTEISGDREMTDFEKILTLMIQHSMSSFLDKYGIKCSLNNLKLDNILIKKTVEKKVVGCFVAGEYNPFTKKIALYLADYENSPYFVNTLVHEFFHSLSYSSLKLGLMKNGDLFGDHSVGLSMQSEDQGIRIQLFGQMDEALTEILTEKLINEFLSEQLLSGLQKPYLKEKEKLLDFINYINKSEELKKMEGKDSLSEDEVFGIFLRAYFNGEILPLARLLEEDLGKGWFRKIGEAYSIVG